MWRSTSSPLRRGSLRSRRTRAGCSAASFSRAWAPVAAVVTAYQLVQAQAQQVADIGVVVDDEDPGPGWSITSRCPPKRVAEYRSELLQIDRLW